MYEDLRPPVAERAFTSPALEERRSDVQARIADAELAWLFGNCLPNTLDTTVRHREVAGRPDTFVITGDIPAMWLRDSTAQVWPYLRLAGEDPKLARLLAGVLNRQVDCVHLDPYANAFEPDPEALSRWAEDETEMLPGVHERKYELDSLCAVLRLSRGYHAATGDAKPFDQRWREAMDLIVATIRREQRAPAEGEAPAYRFARRDARGTDTLPLRRGTTYPYRDCGLSRCAFRPSDDSVLLPFLVPANAMAVVELRALARLYREVLGELERAAEAESLAGEIDAAIRTYGTMRHPELGEVYAYEVDGFGSAYFMDDANVPSLLSLPYLGYCPADDPLYQATRRGLLSLQNPFYSEGTAGRGIGGPHVGRGFIWPMAIIMQAMTSQDDAEIRDCLRLLKTTHGGTGWMHETFWLDDPGKFTRKWFAWANTLFGELILELDQTRPELLQTPLD
ncbi:MAG: glycoside hydrolase family 125 protein [Verrucomicrobiota bacterium]